MNTTNHANDKGLATDVCHIMSQVYNLGSTLHQAIARLTPLDKLPHDALVDSDMSWSTPLGDPISLRLVGAMGHANNAMHNLRNGLEDLEGLLRGVDKDKYEEPMRRGLKQMEKLAALMNELYSEHKNATTNKVFEIRNMVLAGLVAHCQEAIKASRKSRESRRGKSCKALLGELSVLENRLVAMRSTFNKLRDNPSQKMTKTLETLAAELDAIHQGLVDLEPRCFPTPKIGPARLGLGYNQLPSLAWGQHKEANHRSRAEHLSERVAA